MPLSMPGEFSYLFEKLYIQGSPEPSTDFHSHWITLHKNASGECLTVIPNLIDLQISSSSDYLHSQANCDGFIFDQEFTNSAKIVISCASLKLSVLRGKSVIKCKNTGDDASLLIYGM